MALTAAQQARLDELEGKYAAPVEATAPVEVGDAEFAQIRAKDPIVKPVDRRAELEAKYGKIMPPPDDAPAPPPVEEPSMLDKIGHVAKGLGEGAVNMTANLPGNMSQAAAPASEWALNQMAKNSAAPAWSLRSALPDLKSPLAGALLTMNRANQDPSSGKLFQPEDTVTSNPAIAPYAEMLTSKNFPREAAPAWDSARTFANWGVGGLPNAARKLSTRPDLFMAAGATAGQAIADAAGSDNPVWEAAGAVPAMIAGVVTGKRAILPKASQQALEVLQDNASRSARSVLARAKAALGRGEKGTLADLVDDQGLYNVEGSVAKHVAPFRESIDAAQAARTEQLTGQAAAPFGTANPLEAQAAAAARVAERKAASTTGTGARISARQEAVKPQLAEVAAIDEAAQLRMQAADAAAGQADDAAAEAARVQAAAGQEIATDLLPEQTSAQMAAAAKAARASDRVIEEKAWTEFVESPPFDIMPVRRSVSEIFSEIPAEERAQFTDAYGSLFKDIRKNSEMSPTALQTTLRDINDAITAAQKAGYDARSRLLIELRDGIQKTMDDTHPLYAKARGLNKAARDKYESGRLKNALKDDAEPELFAQTMGQTGTRGAVTSRRLGDMNAPGMPNARFENLKALAQTEKGGVTPAFMQKYRAEVAALQPQERQLFDNYVQTAKQQADAAEAAATAGKASNTALRDAVKTGSETAKKTSALKNTLAAQESKIIANGTKLKKAVDKTLFAQYADKPKQVLRSLLSTTDSAPALKRVQGEMARLGKADEFKASVGNALQERLLKEGVDANELSRTLVEGKVLTLDEVNDIRRATNQMQSMSKRKKAVQLFLEESGDEKRNFLASAMSAVLLPVLPTSHSLVMANALRRYFKHMIGKGAKPEMLVRVEEFMLDPAKYVQAAEAATTANEASRRIMTKLVGAANTAAIIEEVGE